MKLLVMTEKYPPYYVGGYEINCEASVRDLLQRGHEVSVLTSCFGLDAPIVEGNVHRIMKLLDVSSTTPFRNRVRQFKNSLRSYQNYLHARHLIKRVAPDIVYIWQMGGVSVLPAVAAHHAGIPVVYELGDYWLAECRRDYTLEPNVLKRFYRGVLSGGLFFNRLSFKHIVAISDALKRHYVSCGFSPDSIFVLPRGIPKDSIGFKPVSPQNGTRNGGVRMIYAGRLVEDKGVHVAIAAVEQLVNRSGRHDLHLDIVGSGCDNYAGRLQADVAAAGISNHVTFKKQISRKGLLDSYSKYDMFIFPSIWEEPFGMAIIEAMAKGLPVIASRVGGVPEIISDGIDGVLVEPNDRDALTFAMTHLMDDVNFRTMVGKGALQTVRERFSFERICECKERYLLDCRGAARR